MLDMMNHDKDYETVNEYVRDLVLRSKERAYQEACGAMTVVLRGAFARPDCEYELLSFDDIKRRALTRMTTQQEISTSDISELAKSPK
jgi:hypothetical protein